MKILEVRDGFIKFEADSNVCLSSFIQVSGLAKNYVAQVLQIKRSGINSIGIAKILFLYDGALQPYDKTLPPDDAEIKDFTFNILNNSINASEPVIAGEMPGKNTSIIIDASSFNKKMLMSVDDKDENNIIIRNLTKQFNNLNNKVLIIDTLGIVKAKKAEAGVDFKLPLDTASLAFMYQDCLNDATADSKSLIIEIFRDLAEYSETVPFVPFGALKNIVDEMVDKSHVFKLLVLKNKLAKFERLGYFAKDRSEVEKVDRILNSKCAIIDLSKLDSAFQNRYLAFLYEKLKENSDTQVFLELSNAVSKKNLKTIMESPVSTTFVTHSRFKYLNDIKNFFDNFIISPSLTNNEIFKVYNNYLKAMPKGTYLITGEAVNYIPLVSSAKIINEVLPVYNKVSQEEIDEGNTKEEKNSESVEKTNAAVDNEQPVMEQKEVSGFEETEESASPNSEVADSTSEIAAAPEAQIMKAELEVAEEEMETEEPISDTEDAAVEPEIIDSDVVEEQGKAVEEVQEEQNRLSKEEIFANIEEKSDTAISEAAKDLTPPAGGMFDDDESEASMEEILEEEVSQSEEKPSQEEVTSVQEEDELNIEDLDNQEVSEQEASELEVLIADENDANLQDSQIEEIPLDDAFESNIEDEELQEIQDYIPEDNAIETVEEIDELGELITEDKSENDILEELSDDNTEEFNIEPEAAEEETEIDIPEGFDLDMNSDNESSELLEEVSDESLKEDNIIPLEEDNSELDEIVELDPNEATDDDIIIDMSDEEDSDSLPQDEDDLDTQIVKDVDKVFTTRKDDDISDSDLDFIDELNSDNDILEAADSDDADNVLEEISDSDDADGIIEELPPATQSKKSQDDNILETKNSSTPIVPVYDADIPQEDMVISDPIQQGDTVMHAKYGSGVVEKMIKYGNKTLFSINFDNIGRRLLDPTLTEIKKA